MVKQKQPAGDYSIPPPLWRGKGMRVPKATSKAEVKVTVNIQPIKSAEVTPAQRQLVKNFWQRLIAECQRELQAESEAKK